MDAAMDGSFVDELVMLEASGLGRYSKSMFAFVGM